MVHILHTSLTRETLYIEYAHHKRCMPIIVHVLCPPPYSQSSTNSLYTNIWATPIVLCPCSYLYRGRDS